MLKNSHGGPSLSHAVNTCITLLKALTTWWLSIYCLLMVMERPYSKDHKSACITWKYWKVTQSKSGKSHYAELWVLRYIEEKKHIQSNAVTIFIFVC